MTSEDFTQLKELADNCTTIEEVRALYLKAPTRGKARLIYQTRWVELNKALAVASAAACSTPQEALTLYLHTSKRGPAKAVYKARWIELAKTKEKAKATTRAPASQNNPGTSQS